MAKGGFRGMPGGMNQAAMLKQAQKMQQEMLRMQEEMENKTYTAAAGGGMVKATVSGKHQLMGLEINPEAVDPEAHFRHFPEAGGENFLVIETMISVG